MLKTRIITAFILLIILATVLWIGSIALAATCALVTGAIIYEFLSVAIIPARRGAKLYQDDVVIYSLFLSLPGLGLVCFGSEIAIFLTVFAVTAFLIRECFLFESSPDEGPAKEIISAFAIALLYPFFFGLMLIVSLDRVAILFGDYAWRVVVWFISLVIFSDTAAYFGGKFFGRTKLAPRISPNKTVEGAVSGFVCVLIFSQLLCQLLSLPSSTINLLFVAVLIGLLAPVGDLVESWIKRLYGVKDMGDLLPGHGGVFDRVDSYIFASLALFFLTL